MAEKNNWQVYILKCSDGTLYAGVTTDLERRIQEHNDSMLGAKYTRGRRPVKLVYQQDFSDRSSASKEECRIKKMSRGEKLSLINFSFNRKVTPACIATRSVAGRKEIPH